MLPISSFQPNTSYSIDPPNSLDSTTVAKARETAARALDKNSILCPVLSKKGPSHKKPGLSPDFDIVTNEQWSLIESFFIMPRNRKYSSREHFNAILYRYTGDKSSWNLIKKRFEKNGFNFQQRIRVQYSKWKREGRFIAAHEELVKKNCFPELQKKLDILIKGSNQERELIPRLPIIADAEEPNHFENPEKVHTLQGVMTLVPLLVYSVYFLLRSIAMRKN